jgi:hypothetical protein
MTNTNEDYIKLHKKMFKNAKTKRYEVIFDKSTNQKINDHLSNQKGILLIDIDDNAAFFIDGSTSCSLQTSKIEKIALSEKEIMFTTNNNTYRFKLIKKS